MTDIRLQQLNRWLASTQYSNLQLTPLSGDASSRRYFRADAAQQKLVIMDSPAPLDVAPFVDICQRLHSAGLNAPKILASSPTEGFLVLSDLGEKTYLDAVNEQNSEVFFSAAISALVTLQSQASTQGFSEYDRPLLERELALFPDWYIGHHKPELGGEAVDKYFSELSEDLVGRIVAMPKTFVHRDYMVRNLMVSQPMPGIIDFQDAVIGPYCYDIASLCKDAFISWPQAQVEQWQTDYWHRANEAGVPVAGSLAQFFQDCDVMAVQRHLKVIGIFARIRYRDGKPAYLEDVPRFVSYLRGAEQRLRKAGCGLRSISKLLAEVWPT